MSSPTSKATWTPGFHGIFVDLCLREMLKNEPGSTRITKVGWRNIVGSFYAKTGVRYEKKQFKNHYDSTRKLWKVWVKLTDDSNMKWDPETRTFGASEEDWQNYIKATPEAAQFQSKEIQFTDKLDIIFDGGNRVEEMKRWASLKWQNDASATSPLRGKEREKKRKHVGRDYESDSTIMVGCSPTPKASWTPAYHKMFVDLCIEETLNGNKNATHFTKEGWRNIVGSFNAKTGMRYDKKQIKNHYDSTRKLWKIWAKLIGDDKMKWDPHTNTFGASEEDWHNCIKAFPEAAQFRFKELQFSDKLRVVFDGAMPTEEMVAMIKRQNDASATLRGKEREKKRRNVGRDSGLKSAIMVNAIPISTVPSEQSMSSSSHPKVKAAWTPTVHKIFVDLCLQETLQGNKPGTHFTKEGWKNIMETFYAKTDLNYGRLQLKNHWDSTKEQWKIWCKLIGTNYMKWDPSNLRFEASEEDWNNYLQENPEASQFRLKELQFTDMLEAIFNGTTVTGETEPTAQQRKSDDSVITFPFHTKEPDTVNFDEKTECHCDAVASRIGVSIQKNASAVSSTEGKCNYSIGECIECLDRMEEIEQGSELYMFALDVFLKQEYREIFLQLKTPNLRISWLQRLQSSGPPPV
ncbi:L10-interacting MYB domain-containing protein [Vigna angularis]|uniref:L10-interacting MYB domain-containing protein n=1 Tax=Phaseolus angularis TaxID=3914 RepID=A0A8T0L5R9_PHAAN|nr:L10-interacting MYB domain-containing protein isoform X2 [Vigna angularis]KAG2406278.1 L10-interacting MYB domain-containing protein [Vigna angularis]